MNVSSLNDGGSSKSAKRKFMQWASKWFYAEIHDDEQIKPDTPSLICLLQSIGFQLRKFEKSEDFFGNPIDESVRITLECGSSRMKAVMELNDVKCQCPCTNDPKNISMWSVSGITPTGSTDSINKIEESGSNLLPRVSKDTRQMIHDVTHCLFNTINHKNDTDFNDGMFNKKRTSASYNDLSKAALSSSFTNSRGHTNPEFALLKLCALNNSTSSLSKLDKPLQDERRKTISGNMPDIKIDRVIDPLAHQNNWTLNSSSYQVAPPESPKIIKTSPGTVKQLCSVFDGNNELLTMAECLKRAKYYIEKVQSFDCSSNESSAIVHHDDDDDVFVKPTMPPPKTTQTRTTIAVKKILNTTITSPSSNLSSRLSAQSKLSAQNKLSTQNKLQSRKSIGDIDSNKKILVKQVSERVKNNYGLSSSSIDLTALKSSKNSSILKRPKLIRTSTQTKIDSSVSTLTKTKISPIKTTYKASSSSFGLSKTRGQFTSASTSRLASPKIHTSTNVKTTTASVNSGIKKATNLSTNESSKTKNTNIEKQKFGYVKSRS